MPVTAFGASGSICATGLAVDCRAAKTDRLPESADGAAGPSKRLAYRGDQGPTGKGLAGARPTRPDAVAV